MSAPYVSDVVHSSEQKVVLVEKGARSYGTASLLKVIARVMGKSMSKKNRL